MRITTLTLANLRAIKEAKFQFQPGFNLIVGVNGVGKTSALDALAVCLSATVKQAVKRLTKTNSFLASDIRAGTNALTVRCGVSIGPTEYSYLVHRPRDASSAQSKKAGMPREQVHDTPIREEFVGEAPKTATGKEPEGRPFAVLFSTRRALASERAPSAGTASGGVPAAYAGAFSDRPLELGEFAWWMKSRIALKAEDASADRVLKSFEKAVRRFLPGYSNLRVSDEKTPTLLIDRDKSSLPVKQLSDGERGTLALVLDLTRRLAQANPEMSDPAAKAEAVVLIDEIDLHLHPRWQRLIVKNLTETFPKCQFIATTHSPQVIGEVEHDRIQIIANGDVYSPPQSFGVDSSRVLEEIMEAPRRSADVADLLVRLSRATGDEKYKQAKELLAELAGRIGEDDPDVIRARTLLEFMEGNE